MNERVVAALQLLAGEGRAVALEIGLNEGVVAAIESVTKKHPE